MRNSTQKKKLLANEKLGNIGVKKLNERCKAIHKTVINTIERAKTAKNRQGLSNLK